MIATTFPSKLNTGLSGIRVDQLWAGIFSVGSTVTLPKSILNYNFLAFVNGFGSTSIVHVESYMQVVFNFNANGNIYTIVYSLLAETPYILRIQMKAMSVILSDGTSQMFSNSDDSPITAIYGIKI